MKRLIVYVQALLIALILVATGTDAQAQTVLTYDFENYDVDHEFGVTSGSGTPVNKVVLDPLNASNKVIRFTPGGAYNNSGLVLAFTLPTGRTLADYTSLTFKLLMRGSDGDVGFKDTRVGAFESPPSGSFISNSNQSYHIHSSVIGTAGTQATYKSMSIPITNSKTFSGTVYIVIGWHTNSPATWHLDDVELVGPGDLVSSCLVDPAVLSYNFQDYDVDHEFGVTSGSGTPVNKVVLDPLNASNKVIRFTPGGAYNNSGLVLAFTLPSGRQISEYTHLNFKLLMRGSDGDVGFKDTRVGAFQNPPSGSFVSNSNQSYHIHSSVIGTAGTQATYKSMSIPITNSKTFSGTVYIVIGWHTNSPATWHLDDVELVGPGPAGTGECTATITGTAGWRLLSFPIAGGKLSDIADDTAIQGIPGGPNSSNAPNVLIFKEGNSSFATPSHVDTPFGDGYGFATYFFNNNLAGSSELPVTLSVLGSEPATDVTVNLNQVGDYTLVGNPFSSNFNISTITATGGTIQNTVMVWNNTGTYIGLDRTASSEQNLKIFQGFWVESSNNATSITFPKYGKTPVAGTGYFGKVQDMQSQRGDIRFKLASETTTDEAIRLSFRENAIIGWDLDDASKFVPLLSKYAILSLVGDEKLKSVYSLPYGLEKAHEVEMKLDLVGVSGEFTLSWTGIQTLPEGWTFTLFDYETGESIEMNNESEYVFNASSSVSAKSANEFTPGSPNLLSSDSEGGNRFGIRITPSAPVSVDGNDTMVREMSLDQNYPNPFNPSTQIGYTISESSHVTLRVYDLLGRQVATLVDENRAAGSYKVTFNAAGLSSGVYIYRLESAGQVLTKRMTLLK